MLVQIDKIGSLHFPAEFVGEACKNKSGVPLTCKYYLFFTTSWGHQPMIRSLLIVIMFIPFNQSAMAHKCILTGNSAAEIMVYNACKNDLAFGNAGHDSAVLPISPETSDYIKNLEAENKALKAKLLVLRGRLLDLARILD